MNDFAISITVGFTPGAEALLTRLVTAWEGRLSSDDQAALTSLLAAQKALQNKADVADNKAPA